MANRDTKSTGPDGRDERRRSADRRRKPREAEGGRKGRRSTDVAAESREASALDQPDTPARKRRATRDGREPLVIYLRPESIKALKIAALELDVTASSIMADALGLWFRSEGRSPRR